MGSDVHVGKELRENSLFDNPNLIPFRRSDLKRSPFFSSSINQKQFVNAMNFRNFVDDQIFAHMVFPHTREEFLFKVIPGPCTGNEVTFTLPEGSIHGFEDFVFKGLFMDNGKSVIIMHAEPVLVTTRLLAVKLGKTGAIYQSRQARRHLCRNVQARVTRGDLEYAGLLYEFNPAGLRIELKGMSWKDGAPDEGAGDIMVDLIQDGRMIFSGASRLIRTENQGSTIVLSPVGTPRKGNGERKNRNPRLNLVPSPELKFTHPLTGRKVSYGIHDINSAGFSVMVDEDASLIMPGMIIEEASIEFAGGMNLKCPVKVLYGEKKKKNTIRYGFRITDIDVASYNRLFNVISRADDPYARVSYDMDMASLWNFFFESGFMYPERYTKIARYKDDFKETYDRLYHQCPDIFANLTYERNGVIYGHVSLIKAYERSWLVNHLATKDVGLKITGHYVLRQILNYLDSITRMPSVGMEYLIVNFPHENRFPNNFFSSAYKAVNNPEHLSLDTFAYLSVDLPPTIPDLPRGWTLSESSQQDITALGDAYRQHSDGILLDALCLDPGGRTGEAIDETYRKHSLGRVRSACTLFQDGSPKAYFVKDRSDRGVNLSEFINSIKVIVPKYSTVPWYVLYAAICSCGHDYDMKTVPVQVFPCEYMDRAGIPYKKRHVVWVLDTSYLGENMDIIKDMARLNPAQYLKGVVSSFIWGE